MNLLNMLDVHLLPELSEIVVDCLMHNQASEIGELGSKRLLPFVRDRDIHIVAMSAAYHGHLSFVKYLFRHRNGIILETIFYHACEGGKKDVMQWVIRQPVMLWAIRYDYPCIPQFINVGFQNLCFRGHHNLARWLLDHFEMINVNEGLIKAIKGGHIEITQWLVCARDARDREAFRCACRHGQTHIAKWLKTFYQIENEHDELDELVTWLEFCPIENEDLFEACLNGHEELVTWLLETIEFTRGHEAFQYACQGGHNDIAQLLINIHDPFSPQTYDNALRAAFWGKKLHTMKWLHEYYDARFRNPSDIDIEGACRSGYKDIVQWVSNVYGASFALYHGNGCVCGHQWPVIDSKFVGFSLFIP